jgi:hypothetical protein
MQKKLMYEIQLMNHKTHFVSSCFPVVIEYIITEVNHRKFRVLYSRNVETNFIKILNYVEV